MEETSSTVADRPHVTRIRRTYNKWAANETLEDFALRFTAHRARRWSYGRVANTALGSISFLALEAIGGAITLTYGFENAVTAILIVGVILFLTGLPISYHAARTGVDIDLLTRGAGFGYIGSTVTSLVYATFTFLFFALEAVILSYALELFFGVPLWMGYILNALIVIPLVTHGFSRIGTFQKWTQPAWIVLQVVPFIALALSGASLTEWQGFAGRLGAEDGSFDIVLCAAAAGVALALMAQIGEQVDFLRFLPEPKTASDRRKWWAAVVIAGPGWAVIGTLKMLAGSYLAVQLVEAGSSIDHAVDPTRMYLSVYQQFLPHEIAVLLTALFVLLAQVKINVTNAYAGSIAWSNFFSRLTHTHPGRVVWLVFNVAIAVMVMQFGVFGALEQTLALYAHIAVAWIGAIAADLVINRAFGISPRDIEFRRSHLFDLNPVGIGATLLATVVSLAAYLDLFGEVTAAFSGFIALGIAILAAPCIAIATGGRYYTIPKALRRVGSTEATFCTICENPFDPPDMLYCPYHSTDICSLCCALETRCADICRPGAALSQQMDRAVGTFAPPGTAPLFRSRYGTFLVIAVGFTGVVGLILLMVHHHGTSVDPGMSDMLGSALWVVFGLLVIVIGVASWLLTLAGESREVANDERELQTARLQAEIRAHRRTDEALQRAKDKAEAANDAKSRYVAGISHELRTPLSAILGYAQLLENDPTTPPHSQPGLRVMRRSSEHLADLIEGLLDISKIEAGKLEISRTETPLRELVDQMAAIFRMQAIEKGLRFAYDASRDVPERVYADERRVRQILMNLLSNAVRYTGTGEIRFSVAFRGDVATFAVEDTGCGIAPEQQDRIFLPFERIETPGLPVPGTGLGLTIAKLLTEMLGGEMTLTSTSGHGSCFQVRLMLPRIADTSPAEPQRRLYGYRGPRRRLLIVDDNLDHRKLLEDTLRPLGFALSMAESGMAALVQARVAPPDLALLDVAMPGMSGWALAAQLRTDLHIDAPIVMVSAHANDTHEGMQYHDDFITKPFNIDHLLSRLERHLKLEWIDEAPDQTTPRYRANPCDLDAISDLLAIGHVRAVEDAIGAISTCDPEMAAFVREAKRRLETLDLDGLARFVHEVRHAR